MDYIAYFVSWLISVATFVVIGTYTYYAGGQLREMRKSTIAMQGAAVAAGTSAQAAKTTIENSDQYFRIQERPYVVVKKAFFEEPLKAGDVDISVVVDNSGRTPALKVTYVAGIYINGKLIGEKPSEGESVVASLTPEKQSFRVGFSSPDVELINTSKTAALKIKGVISYVDIFSDSHTTTYCFTYEKTQDIFKFCPGNDVR